MIDTSKPQDRIMDRTLLRSKFIKRFSSDPETVRDIRDIEKIEQIDADERFPCQYHRPLYLVIKIHALYERCLEFHH